MKHLHTFKALLLILSIWKRKLIIITKNCYNDKLKILNEVVMFFIYILKFLMKNNMVISYHFHLLSS